jgi:glycosyltransferase involved in cell wall biosynthesis
MASKKPIIASNIDGVPDLIKDGYNGLLFKSENHADLADKISLILSDNNLANQLAENGFNYVQKYLSEECYITKYKAMIDDLFNKSRPD